MVAPVGSAKRADEPPAVHVSLMNGMKFVIAFVLLILLAAGFIVLGIPDFTP